MSILEARQVSVAYGATTALADVSLALGMGSRTAVMGPSGSGKSSLVHALAGIVTPATGEVLFNGSRLDTLSEVRRSRIRLERFGMVFQFGDLVPELTLLENTMLPLQVIGTRSGEARRRALELLDRLGVAAVADRRAGAVSGGQAQRAAVARALAHHPSVVLADEPTGALDSVNAEQVMETLVEVCAETGSTLVVVTHDHRVAAHLDQVVVVRDGRIAVGIPA
jgi:putative ABC transport system ATP-binding protein